eukprot:TRINITY_DN2120_c0_g2_i1.p1 TRINITY_DN2120_c0_g2~~TRINITY_DN2120_c0_g2_i1.p1  ORF type:complete len:348 (+),score=69.27 TRINITY_DN2120_c0_g2_i1:45-1088(+)
MAEDMFDVPLALKGVRGINVFRDIFIRADKNDDGKIQLDEFLSYFADDVVGQDELHTIFNSMDTDKSGTIEVDELCKYFLQGFDEYAPAFDYCENLNKVIFDILLHTSRTYSSADRLFQFRIRFFLREIQTAIETMSCPLDSALDTIIAQSQKTNSLPHQQILEKAEHTNSTHSTAVSLGGEVERLRLYLNELATFLPRQAPTQLTSSNTSSAAVLKSQQQAASAPESDASEMRTKAHRVRITEGGENCVIVCRRANVIAGQQDAFVALAKEYFQESLDDVGAFKFCVRPSPSLSTRIVLWEVWDSSANVAAHDDLPHSKEFASRTSAMVTEPIASEELPSAANLFL